MLTDSAREGSRRLLEPVAKAMGRVGLTPNGLTLLGSLLHLLVVWPLWRGELALAGLLLALAAAFDGVDGTLARLTGQASPFGAFLDSTMDRISEILVFVGLLLYVWAWRPGDPVLAAVVLLGLGGSLLTSYTRARSEALNLGTKVGVLGRLERMLLLVLGLVLAGATGWGWVLDLTLWILLAGAWWTTAWRMWDVRRLAAANGSAEGRDL